MKEEKETKNKKVKKNISNMDLNIKEEKNILEDDLIIGENNEFEETKNLFNKKLDLSIMEGVTLVAIFLIVFGTIGYIFGSFNKNEKYSDEVMNFLNHYNNIVDNYYTELDEEKLMDAALDGILSELDDYSEVLDSESNSFDIQLNGSYQGVGIEIYNSTADGSIIVSNVFENTPADLVGLMAGDIILAVDGESLEGKLTSYLVEVIGSKSEVLLTVKRNEETFEVELYKDYIVLESVHYEMYEKTGYIKIDVFAANTHIQVKSALEALEKVGMEKLIIDVRNNSGGYLSAAEEILSLFLDESYIMYNTEDKDNYETFYSKGKESFTYPIVILQNFASASASELLAISLQENLNAFIIGETSFGKGTVQTVQNADDVEYKITTKKWLSPEGNWINEIGVEPDLEVSTIDDYYFDPSFENDNVLKAALEHLGD